MGIIAGKFLLFLLLFFVVIFYENNSNFLKCLNFNILKELKSFLTNTSILRTLSDILLKLFFPKIIILMPKSNYNLPLKFFNNVHIFFFRIEMRAGCCCK